MSISLPLLCEDGAVWSEIEQNRLSLVIERSGSEDGGVRYGIERLAVANEFLASALDPVTFADKERVRALQLADYLAYYSFRLALSARHSSEEGATELLYIALQAVVTHKNMGGDFVPSRDFATAIARAKRKRKEARRGEG
jgi:hypothetical protein